MFNRREQREIAEGRRVNSSAVLYFSQRTCLSGRQALRLFLLLFFFSHVSFASTDTTKTKLQYDINDPRNPNCPCHQYQQLAEKEYEKDLRITNLDLGIENSSVILNEMKNLKTDASHRLSMTKQKTITNHSKQNKTYLTVRKNWKRFIYKTKKFKALPFGKSLRGATKRKVKLDKCFLW